MGLCTASANRLGVGGVVLLALDIGLYELRRHQTDIVPKSGDLSSPIVCRVAGLNPNQGRVQFGKERQHLRASELSFDSGLSRIVDAMNLKDVLGQVQSDYCYLHYPPPSLRSPLTLRSIGNQGKRGRPFQHDRTPPNRSERRENPLPIGAIHI